MLQLPEIKPVDPKILEQNEIAFKFMRNFVEVLRIKYIANRPVSMLDDSYSRIEIANVTRDNCALKAGEAAGMVCSHSAGNNVFEFSRLAVAVPEANSKQYTLCFYGLWKTEELKRPTNAESKTSN